jgi:hypothetical protein
MSARQLSGRTVQIAALVTAFVVCGLPASSQARENSQCVSAYKKGQQLWKAGHLFQAKESMAKCTKLICSAGLRKECSSYVQQLDNDTPTVVLNVTDDRNRPVTNVRVMMDGSQLVSQIDGRAVPVDPGAHEFVFETAGVVFAKEKAVVLQGQRNRPITVGLQWARKGPPGRDQNQQQQLASAQQAPPRASAPSASPPAAPPAADQQVDFAGGGPSWGDPPASATAPAAAAKGGNGKAGKKGALAKAAMAAPADEPAPEPVGAQEQPVAVGTAATPRQAGEGPSTATYVTAVVGVAGLAGFGLMTYWGRVDNQQLKNCSPTCPKTAVDHVKKMYLAANIAAGVGAAALVTWAYLAFIAPDSGPKEAATRGPSYSVGVSPIPAGGVASISGSF